MNINREATWKAEVENCKYGNKTLLHIVKLIIIFMKERVDSPEYLTDFKRMSREF